MRATSPTLPQRARRSGARPLPDRVHSWLVLRYQHYFFGLEPIDFSQNLLHRPAPLRSTKAGDGAEAARAVAPFGDLHVGPWSRPFGRGRLSRSKPGRRRVLPSATATGPRGTSKPATWSTSGRASATSDPLGETTGDDEFSSFLFHIGERQDRVDRLLPGFFDERTGVDHDHVGRSCVGRRLQPIGEQRALELVGVDLVLRATQGFECGRCVPP